MAEIPLLTLRLASAKHSRAVASSPPICKRESLGKGTTALACFLRSLRHSSAWACRDFSQLKGIGVKAKTRAPLSRAIRATTGATPPPVPPPSPARRKTRSTPSSCLRRRSFSSSIARLANAYSPPVPIPRVCRRPKDNFSDARESDRVLRSTSTARLSTASKLSNRSPSIKETPAPPTPMILALMLQISFPW